MTTGTPFRRRRCRPFRHLATLLACLAWTAGWSTTVLAGEVDVIAVEATRSGSGVYNFQVTLKHADAGWEHYADAWQVLDLDGKQLGERVLFHPHDKEQPFTRSATIEIPAGTRRVKVRGHDKRHGFGGREMTVDLAQ